MAVSILLVCAACFAASAENAGNSDFEIIGTTLVKYHGNGEEVTVPDGIEVLGEEAFQSTGVTKVNLPESLKTIGSHCFLVCSRLEEITLPASLEGLENVIQPFSFSGLKEFKTAEGGKYKAVDGVLFTADGKTLVCYPSEKDDVIYAIPEGTERLGRSPFDGFQAISLYIPSTLTDMETGFNIFEGSSNLQEFNVSPDNKKFYSKGGALYTGNRLIAYPAQKYWNKLKPTDFPAGLKEIGPDAFCSNDDVESVELPEGVEVVGTAAFYGMKSLKTVVVPASVKDIDPMAFVRCENLERVTVLNPDVNVQGYADYDPKGYNILRWNDTTNAVLCGYAGGNLQAYAEKCGLKFETLDPETGKVIETAAETATAAPEDNSDFEINGTTLVKYKGPGGEVTVPDGIETLGEWAFSGSGVTKVNLPESLKTIDYYCFHSCDTLEEITIPASVVDIMETQAFAYNTNLKAIHVAEGNPCYTSVDGVLFTGNGQKLLYYPAGKNRGGKYAIPEGTVSLGCTAFEGTGLTAVTLPSSLVTLEGGNDFSSNYELEEIRVAEGNPRFRSVEGMLFDQAGKLLCYPAGRKTEIMGANDFPAEMTAIGPWAFQYVQHLRSITVPNGIKTINWMCFTWAKSLESVILPASVNYIAGYAFADCPELRQVVILNPDAYIVLDDERFSDDYRAKMNFNIVDESPKAVLYGYEGSTAQEYAGLRDDTFVSLGQGPARNTDAAAEPGERQVVPGCAQ